MGRFIVRRGGRWGCLAAALGVVLIFSGCGGGGGSDAGGKATEEDKADAPGTPVKIVNFLFDPQELQVSPGTKVTWTNEDDAAHNIQDLSDLNTPISTDLEKGQRFSITYEKPGSYPYVCGLHTYMTGTVKVA
jgi:plastocyanin